MTAGRRVGPVETEHYSYQEEYSRREANCGVTLRHASLDSRVISFSKCQFRRTWPLICLRSMDASFQEGSSYEFGYQCTVASGSAYTRVSRHGPACSRLRLQIAGGVDPNTRNDRG